MAKYWVKRLTAKSNVKRVVIWVVFLGLLVLSVYAGDVLAKEGIHVPVTHRYGVTTEYGE